MRRRAPRSTRTDTLFPYTTLFRSGVCPSSRISKVVDGEIIAGRFTLARSTQGAEVHKTSKIARCGRAGRLADRAIVSSAEATFESNGTFGERWEERRVGKECDSTCRSRWSPVHYKKKRIQEVV